MKNYCPICKRESYFLPGGTKPRPQAKCPRCGSLERHRLLIMYLVNQTNIFYDEVKVLHFAPEQFITNYLRQFPNITYVSADLFAPAMLKIDITDIKLPSNQFDIILCYHILEHVQEDVKAMKEMFRILKPGGWAIIQVPLSSNPDTFEDPLIITPEDRLKYYGQNDHVRLYGWNDYLRRLANAGFTVLVDPFVKTLDRKDVFRMGLNIIEDIYVCKKP